MRGLRLISSEKKQKLLIYYPSLPTRAKLDELLTKHIEVLAEQDGYKRNIPMFVVALVGTPAMILLTMHVASLGGWWWILATATGFLALAFLYGIFDSIQLAP